VLQGGGGGCAPAVLEGSGGGEGACVIGGDGVAGGADDSKDSDEADNAVGVALAGCADARGVRMGGRFGGQVDGSAMLIASARGRASTKGDCG